MIPSTAMLQETDWTFGSAKTQEGPHGIHPYPAKFIPQIPHNLIKHFPPPPGTVVLDPFCGSGTTLVEAMNFGLPSVGIDLSPIACLIAKVKTTPLTPRALDAVGEVVKAAIERLESGDYAIPSIPKLDHWFTDEAQCALASLTAEVDLWPDVDVRDAMRVALSSLIVRLSNQESDTRYAAIEKTIKGAAAFPLFSNRAANVIRATFSMQAGLMESLPKPKIINQDVLSVTKAQVGAKVGLVVTSPPYPNAYEYWLYHKYRMYWLGMDPIAVREKEIGARAHFFKKNAHTAENFMVQMSTVFKLIASVLVPSGVACFLIGRSIIKGDVVDNLEILKRAGAASGLALLETVERTIPRTRKAFNLSHAAIHKEHIAIFGRKP